MASAAAGSSKQQQQVTTMLPSSRGGGWTQRQNKQFECALAVYDRETPDRWHNVARYMGGAKSADEVRRHFEQLVEDVARIESGRVPFPRYAAAGLDDGRSRYLKFQ
ncbi:protein RADIALIS-like 3 [Oryza brachyantha]|uniref:protein RADIALIS-like 3 n=1 Tax=Oryza brachyantha TaxID=4533 RepID=UPI0003EAD1F8|nr:protein RADIALIS-like 3 [Oryza brachyantha]